MAAVEEDLHYEDALLHKRKSQTCPEAIRVTSAGCNAANREKLPSHVSFMGFSVPRRKKSSTNEKRIARALAGGGAGRRGRQGGGRLFPAGSINLV
jgi:hypothetical protein